METGSVGIVLAFTAGLLSFLSPCVLPLIPSYVTFITGVGIDDLAQERRAALVHGLLFILGFTMVFLALGATATLLGRVMFQYRDWITRIGGLIIIAFGLYLLGVVRISALARERRVHVAAKPVGYFGSVLVGLAFGAGWTPCLGPVLASILVFTSSQADFARGMGLLASYSLGLAVPFLLSALAVEHFMAFFRRMRHQMVWVTRVTGALMIGIGLLLVTNYFTILASYLQAFTPEALLRRL